jgi:hypothetical protein
MKTDIYFDLISLISSYNENCSRKIVEKIKTHILCSVNFCFRKSCRLWENVEKSCKAGGAGHRWQYGACALNAGYLRLQTHTHTYSLLFHYNNGCPNAPQCYVMRTLPFLFLSTAGPQFNFWELHQTKLKSGAHWRLYSKNVSCYGNIFVFCAAKGSMGHLGKGRGPQASYHWSTRSAADQM